MAKRKRTDLIVVHVTASALKYKMTNAKLLAGHKARGFSDIGYNEWIDRAGKLHKGRAGGPDMRGAHVGGYNSIAFGISLEGGRDTFDMTDAQMATLERRLRELCAMYPNAKICGHRDLSPDADGDGVVEPHEHIKMCPQFDVIPWAEKLGLPGADIKGVWKTHGKEGPDARERWLQKLLKERGYAIVPDGHVGPKTVAVIKQFQIDAGLPVTGKFDTKTVAALRQADVDKRAAEAKPKRIPPPAPREKKVPVEPDGLDKPALNSKTILTNIFQKIGGWIGGIGVWWSDLSTNEKIVVSVAAVVVVLISAYVIKERYRFIKEARAIKKALEE